MISRNNHRNDIIIKQLYSIYVTTFLRANQRRVLEYKRAFFGLRLRLVCPPPNPRNFSNGTTTCFF